MQKLSKKELIDKLSGSEIVYHLKGKGKIIGRFKLLNQFWTELFESLEVKKARMYWKSFPTVFVSLRANGRKKRVRIDEVEIELVKDRKTWYSLKKKISPILLSPQDSMNIAINLETLWNGR